VQLNGFLGKDYRLNVVLGKLDGRQGTDELVIGHLEPETIEGLDKHIGPIEGQGLLS
jgi:hypothetical protein